MNGPTTPIVEVGRYGAGRFQFAAPGDRQHDMWILRFDDADRRDMVFDGRTYDDPEAAAWTAWNQAAPTWNCRVFRTALLASQVPGPISNERGDEM